MLDPNARLLYLEALRPPEGYHLDRAVATTFTLDLFTLLMAPLSFVMFECESRDQAFQNPVALLDALQQTTKKLSVFCQKGRIAVPSADQLPYSYLEPMVVDVMPENPSGFFHPKIWLMRFVAEGKPVVHRLLCLSRNLTFDESWDTVLALEGTVQQRKIGYGRNRPLSDFIAYLPNLAARGNDSLVQVSDRIVRDTKLLSEEVRRVDFKPPLGFGDKIAFRPVGIPGYQRFSIKGRVDRLLIVSPFLSGSLLTRLTKSPPRHVLVSRVESLDELRENESARFGEILVMDEAAARLGELDEQNTEEAEVSEAEDVESGGVSGLFGLHAKLFVAKAGRDARLWTGSANATNAAFGGRNIEFMVELHGKHSKIGIDKILAHDDNRTTFRDLLKSYVPPKERPPPDPELRQLEERVESIRRGLLTLDLQLSVRQVVAKSTYDLLLSFDPDKTCPPLSGVEGRCWPITLQRGYAKDLRSLFNAREVAFADMSTVSVTRFIAFELTARLGEKRNSVRFVLNLPIEGMPEDRNDCILRSILSDPNRFLRYLLFLLSEDDMEPTWMTDPRGHISGGGGSPPGLNLGETVLMEKLVRAYSRAPEKLDRIAVVVDALCRTPEGRRSLPEGFEELWQVIWESRLEAKE